MNGTNELLRAILKIDEEERVRTQATEEYRQKAQADKAAKAKQLEEQAMEDMRRDVDAFAQAEKERAEGELAAQAKRKQQILDQLDQQEDAPLLLLLDNIEDPHNLGSILRSADATGVSGVIIPKRRASGLTSVVAKTSTGAIDHVPVARVGNLVQTVQALKERGYWVFGTAMAGEDYRRWNANGKTVLVIGNEGKGISPLLLKQMDQTLTIPMIGHVQSLNASVATGVLLYQAFNSRHPL